jgi:hypothetical protein
MGSLLQHDLYHFDEDQKGKRKLESETIVYFVYCLIIPNSIHTESLFSNI